jgi:hypothetical protein
LQEAADNGRLSSRAARLLNAGMLTAGLVHMRVLLPIMMSELGRPVVVHSYVPTSLAVLAC